MKEISFCASLQYLENNLMVTAILKDSSKEQIFMIMNALCINSYGYIMKYCK